MKDDNSGLQNDTQQLIGNLKEFTDNSAKSYSNNNTYELKSKFSQLNGATTTDDSKAYQDGELKPLLKKGTQVLSRKVILKRLVIFMLCSLMLTVSIICCTVIPTPCTEKGSLVDNITQSQHFNQTE